MDIDKVLLAFYYKNEEEKSTGKITGTKQQGQYPVLMGTSCRLNIEFIWTTYQGSA